MDQDDGRELSRLSSAWDSRLDSFFHGAFLTALILMALVTGAVLTAADIFPGPQIVRAYQGGKAFYDKLTVYDDVYRSDLWYPARTTRRGVSTYVPSRAANGLTLYTSGHDATALLVAMDGTVVHRWRRPFSTVWNPDAKVRNPRPDSHVYFRKAVVYPNGDLLAVYEGVGDTPYGYGMVKLDRHSNVIWSYLAHTHHDIDIGPDGRIYVLTQEVVDEPFPPFDNLASPRLQDYLVVLSPEGRELKKVSLLDAVAKSPYRGLIHTIPRFAAADPLHANNVDLITAEMAAPVELAEPGQILLSFREPSAIAVLDLDTEQLAWAARGYWLGQHDPDLLPNGHILMFDNFGNFEVPEKGSRVIEIEPRTMRIVWRYVGSVDNPLDSDIRSDQQRLANGNTLITESSGGRILEVTRQGEIVWEFHNPVRYEGETEKIPIICWAQRLDPGFFKPGVLAPRSS